MLHYTSRLKTSTVVIRIFITVLSVLLFLTALLAALGMVLSPSGDIAPMIFVVIIAVTAYFMFRISAWNIRRYLIYDDRLEIQILGGLKKIVYPRTELKAFNDLKVLVLNESGGIGLVTQDGKMIKILELEVADFPVFIEHLQKIVRWDLGLKFKEVGGYVQ